MKKNLFLMLVMVIGLTMVIPVAAKGKGPGEHGPNIPGGTNWTQRVYSQIQQGPLQTFAMVGTIAAIDPELKTLKINIINGNKLVHESKGKQITFFVSDETRYLLKSVTFVAPITFEDLVVGQQVSLNGILSVENDNQTWTAFRITVGANLDLIHKR